MNEKLPKRVPSYAGVNIFVSYSIQDEAIAKNVYTYLTQYANVKFWNKSKEPGKEAWPMIFSWIDSADIVLAIITGNTVRRAMSVGHEIGHAKKGGKLIIPLISPGVTQSDLGCLSGITYEVITQETFGDVLVRIRDKVMRIGNYKRTEMMKRKAQEDNGKAVLIIGGALLAAFLLAGG